MSRASFGARILQFMFVSKMTASILDDLDYVVDASAVSLYSVVYVTGQVSHVRRRSTMLVAQQKLEVTPTHETSGGDLTARNVAGNLPSQFCTKWIGGELARKVRFGLKPRGVRCCQDVCVR